MTWQDRLKPFINFTAPNGNVFEASWNGDSRSIEKSLGIFKYPKIPGANAQDMDVGAIRYSIPFYFSGINNDLIASKFLEATKSNGVWKIVHPVKGILNLQPISVTENIQPVFEGNITRFNSEWMEPLQEGSIVTPSQIKFSVINGINNLNETSGSQFDDNIVQNKFGEKNIIQEFTRKIITAVERKLSPLYETSSETKARINAIVRGIIDTLDNEIIDLEVLGSQIQQIVQLPALSTNDAESRLTNYQLFLDDIFVENPSKPTNEQKNLILLQELAAVSSLGVFAEIAVTSDLITRSQAISIAESVSAKFINVTDILDETQELFNEEDIDKQYFSQSESFVDSFTLISQGIDYLLKSIFDLLIEKRFIIKQDRAPIEIAINEYGSLGENDSNFDLFITSNALKADELLLLRSGKEVIVYI